MCEYYDRKCLLKCNICSNFFCCYKHHNKTIEDHYMIPCNIVKCIECSHISIINDNLHCEKCKTLFAEFYCLKCLYFGNRESYHCSICNICYSTPEHYCYKKDITEEICGICLDKIYPTIDFTKLPCDHLFHKKCIKEYSTREYSLCPLCRKYARNIILCSLCERNLCESGYEVVVFKLPCGHRYHQTCLVSLSTRIGNEVIVKCNKCEYETK